jgi:hypothetical protein
VASPSVCTDSCRMTVFYVKVLPPHALLLLCGLCGRAGVNLLPEKTGATRKILQQRGALVTRMLARALCRVGLLPDDVVAEHLGAPLAVRRTVVPEGLLARWLKTQHFMQRWLGMSFGVTFGEEHMEFYALVNELIEDWMIPMEPSATQVVDPRNAPRSDAIATRGPTYVDVTPPTSFELQLMVPYTKS